AVDHVGWLAAAAEAALAAEATLALAAHARVAEASTAEAEAGLGLGLFVGDGGGDEDLVARDDRRRPGDAGDLDLPGAVPGRGRLGGELAVLRQAAAARAAELRPVAGLAGDRQANQAQHRRSHPDPQHARSPGTECAYHPVSLPLWG